jgi:cobalt transporter subunit CbtA
MVTRALLATIFVGLFSGLVATAIQHWRVVPLIVAAESYEGGGHQHGAHQHGVLTLVAPAFAHTEASSNAVAQPGDQSGPLGLSRFGGTVLANVVTGAGFALLLLAVSMIGGKALTPSNAAAWAACGWLAVHFLPAMGLPPELPGFPTGPLQDRQIWWTATVVLSAGGLWLLAAKHTPSLKIAGLALLALPHVFGAPKPPSLDAPVPPVLAAEYAVATLAASLMFWLVLAVLLALALDKWVRPHANEPV